MNLKLNSTNKANLTRLTKCHLFYIRAPLTILLSVSVYYFVKLTTCIHLLQSS